MTNYLFFLTTLTCVLIQFNWIKNWFVNKITMGTLINHPVDNKKVFCHCYDKIFYCIKSFINLWAYLQCLFNINLIEVGSQDTCWDPPFHVTNVTDYTCSYFSCKKGLNFVQLQSRFYQKWDYNGNILHVIKTFHLRNIILAITLSTKNIIGT